MENKNTTIKVTKAIQEDLQALRRENETYSSIIRRVLDENKQFKVRIDELMALNLENQNIISNLRQREREIYYEKLNEFTTQGKSQSMAYFVIMKITTDIVPSTHERLIALMENAFLQELLENDEKDIIFEACELVKQQIMLGHEDFYNQLNIIDTYVHMIKTDSITYADEDVEDDEF